MLNSKFSVKQTSIKKIRAIFAILLCVLLLPVSVVSVSAESADATLKDLYFNDFAAINFSPTTLSYQANIPYRYIPNDFETFYIPELTAVANDPDASVDITYPDDIDCGTINIRVTASNGAAQNLYTIALNKLGKNLYADGGFELTGANNCLGTYWIGNSDGSGASRAAEYTYAGDWSLKLNPGYSFHGSVEGASLSNGKTYLASTAVRFADGAQNASSENFSHLRRNAAITYYNVDETTVQAETTTDSPVYLPISTEWKRHFKLVTPTADFVNKYDTYTLWGGEQARYIDEQYIGELIIADVNLKDNNNLNESYVPIPAAETNIQLTTEVLNQFGNKIGLEENQQASSWYVEGNPAGVSVSDSGLVTVTSEAQLGSYVIKANVTPSYTGATQGEVYGTYTVTVTDNLPKLSEITVNSVPLSNFNQLTKEYTVYVPYKYIPNDFESFEMPVVSAKAANPAHTVEVVYPESVENGKIFINVTDKDETVNTYEINLSAVGKNLYADGGFELTGANNCLGTYWQGNSDGSGAARAAEYTYAGDWSLKLNPGYSYHASVTPVDLSANKTYLSSVAIRLADGAINYSSENFNTLRSNSTINYYDTDEKTIVATTTDGTSVYVPFKTEWKRHFKTVLPTRDFSFGLDSYTIWGGEQVRYLDEQYIGELVIADVAVSDGTGKNRLVVESGSSAGTALKLSAEAQNQFGNKIGLENNQQVSEWFVVGNTEGISVDATGNVTISANLAPGTYKVAAKVLANFEGAVQDEVCGVYEIIVADNKWTYTKDGNAVDAISAGNIVCGFDYVNAENEEKSLSVYNVLYERIGEILTLKEVSEPAIYMLSYGDRISYENTINIPDDGKDYVIKTFAWDNNLVPVIDKGMID